MITISGIRIDTINANRDKGESKYTFTSNYSLISSTEKVVARQSTGGYGETMKCDPSPQTAKLFEAFITSFTSDISELIGLNAE